MDSMKVLRDNYEYPVSRIFPTVVKHMPGEFGASTLFGYFHERFMSLTKFTTVWDNDRDWYIVKDRLQEFITEDSPLQYGTLHKFQKAVNILVEKDYIRQRKSGQTWYFALGDGFIHDMAEDPYKYLNPPRPIIECDYKLYLDKDNMEITGDTDRMFDDIFALVDAREDVDVSPADLQKAFNKRLKEAAFHYDEEDPVKLGNLVYRDFFYDWKDDHQHYRALMYDIAYYTLTEIAGIESYHREYFNRWTATGRWKLYHNLKVSIDKLKDKKLSLKEYGEWFKDNYGGTKEFNLRYLISSRTVGTFINNKKYREEKYLTI